MEVFFNSDGFRIECNKLEAVGAILAEAVHQDKVSTSEVGFLQPATLEVLTGDDGKITKVIVLFPK